MRESGALAPRAGRLFTKFFRRLNSDRNVGVHGSMTPLKAYEAHTPSCRYTLTLYRTDDGRYLAEYCAHQGGSPGPLMRVGDLNPAPSTLATHQAFYLQSLLDNCLSEIGREAGEIGEVREIPVRHSKPGHECQDETRA